MIASPSPAAKIRPMGKHPSGTSQELWLKLYLARGVGGGTVARLLAAFGKIDAVFAASRDTLDEHGLGAVHAALHDPELELGVQRLQSDLEARPHLRLVTPAGPEYPAHLLKSRVVPPVLWVEGTLAPPATPSVAVVGSRHASRRRTELTAEWCELWARSGVSIVSGLAEGIDGAAHAGALAGCGHTVAVLGTEPDRVYPSRHAALRDRIVASGGAVVTQFAPGTSTHRGHFPARNVTMAGLADIVVIFQAGEDSGSLHTAEAAWLSNRTVWVAPSDPGERDHAGGLKLLRTRARALVTPDDLLQALGLVPASRPGIPPLSLPVHLEAVFAQLDFAGQTLDELTRSLHLSAAEILDRLLELELAGVVARQAGPKYVRIR